MRRTQVPAWITLRDRRVETRRASIAELEASLRFEQDPSRRRQIQNYLESKRSRQVA
jgi:hypothetical protein